ncbi:MAG: methyltransferase domain-containing protein [Rhodocyclaceae bacterium]|nr:methyltransferase domain-containing protein [Rhodocyclaceae bacterium]
MNKSIDWTTVSDDPNNPAAKAAVRAWLKSAQHVHTDNDLLGHIENLVRGRRVLDIGVVSHSARYFDLPDWRHGRIHKAAAHCVGIDILEPLVNELKARGFNVRCVDATSETDLGERFDVVFIGDVVEHVDNAVLLLKFAARHLAPGGRLYVTTPNPFSRKFFRQFRRDGVMVMNLDHVAWITPTLAMELGRRAGISLAAYHLVKRYSPLALAVKRLIGWRLEPVEFSFPDYLYEFVRHD